MTDEDQLPIVNDTTEVVESEEDDPALDSILSALDLPKDAYRDYNKVRQVLVSAVESGQIAVADSLQLAQAMDHPRAYEVFATVMKSTAEVAEKLMEHQERIREITGKQKPGPKNLTQNVIFTGTNKELQQLLKGKMDDLEIDVTPEEEEKT